MASNPVPQVSIKPEEDARLPSLEARIDREWSLYRAEWYKHLKADGTLEKEIKQRALWCVEVLHQYEDRGLNPDQGREAIRELIVPTPDQQ